MSQHQIVIPTKDKLFNLGEFSLRRPGNMITAVILVVGFVLTFIRFTQGIGSITNLSDTEDLVTVMTCNEVFDPNHPDTFFELVEPIREY